MQHTPNTSQVTPVAVFPVVHSYVKQYPKIHVPVVNVIFASLCLYLIILNQKTQGIVHDTKTSYTVYSK